jgi:RNA polymerase sigma-70 factor (ECF subfamily)
MSEQKMLAEQFEAARGHLRAVAYRMLGSQSEAEDAVQEAWLRLSRSDGSGIANLRGWLTTVVSRVCLDMLRSRKSRREEPLEAHDPDKIEGAGEDPEREMALADSMGVALLVVLETLSPAERVAFVLHDMFDLSFDDIAPIVGRTPAAARQLASRARRRVQGPPASSDRARRSAIVDAFLAASRDNDFGALLAVLDPEVVLLADAAAVAASAANRDRGAPELAREMSGAARVAKAFAGRAQGAQPALIDGAVGIAYAPGGKPRAAFRLSFRRGRIVHIDLIADSVGLGRLDIEILAV